MMKLSQCTLLVKSFPKILRAQSETPQCGRSQCDRQPTFIDRCLCASHIHTHIYSLAAPINLLQQSRSIIAILKNEKKKREKSR